MGAALNGGRHPSAKAVKVDGLKGFAEIAKHILYEVLGLLVPGGTFALAVAWAIEPGWASVLLRLGEQHTWLALGGAYILGYPVQSLSRPATTIFEWVLTRPAALLRLVGRVLPESVNEWIERRVAAFESVLTRRHAHSYAADDADSTVDYDVLMHAHWLPRLGLEAGRKLSPSQLRDLSFSELVGDRDRLDRFRAAASLARGVACAVTAVAWIFTWQLVIGERDVTWNAVGVALLGIVAYYGLMERADMYDRLWNAVLRSQFLCVASRTGLPGVASVRSSPTRIDEAATATRIGEAAESLREVTLAVQAPPSLPGAADTHDSSTAFGAPESSPIPAAMKHDGNRNGEHRGT